VAQKLAANFDMLNEQFGDYFSYLSSAVRSLALDSNSKLSIRMVAGFAEIAERKDFLVAGGRFELTTFEL
jgi:hypothetical protein